MTAGMVSALLLIGLVSWVGIVLYWFVGVIYQMLRYGHLHDWDTTTKLHTSEVLIHGQLVRVEVSWHQCWKCLQTQNGDAKLRLLDRGLHGESYE